MSFFEKSKIDLKKHYIITSSASACAISANLTFMLWCLIFSFNRMRALCCGFINTQKNAKDGRESWEAILRNSWFASFGGCFE
jgi:hypothetical protein